MGSHETFEALRTSPSAIEWDGKKRFLLGLTNSPGGIIKVVRQYFPQDANVEPTSAILEYFIDGRNTTLMRMVVDAPSHSLNVRLHDGKSGFSTTFKFGSFRIWAGRDEWGNLDSLGLMEQRGEHRAHLMWVGDKDEHRGHPGNRVVLSEVVQGKVTGCAQSSSGRIAVVDAYPGDNDYIQLTLRDAEDGKITDVFYRAIALKVDGSLLPEHVFGSLVKNPLQMDTEADDKWRYQRECLIACNVLDEGTYKRRTQRTIVPSGTADSGLSRAIVPLSSVTSIIP